MKASRLSFLKMEAFLQRVKGKMKSVEYTSLLGYLDEFNEGKVNIDKLEEVFNEKYPGMFEEFQCVVSCSKELTRAVESAESSNKVKEKTLTCPEIYEKVESNSYETKDHMAKALEFCQQVMKKTSSREYLAFWKALSDYGDGQITIADLKTKIADDFEAFRDDFDCVLDFYMNLNRPSSSSDSEKEINKPNQEEEKVKHSYRLRPKQPSSATEIGNQPRKEHEKVKESRKHRPKRPSSSSEISNNAKKEQATDEEKKRKEKEDEQNRKEALLFKMDMRKAWMRSCKKNAIKLLETINQGVTEDGKMEGIVKKHLTANNFAYFQKMYDADYGSRIVDHLLHSPLHVLPSIIERLKQQDTSPVCPVCDHLEYEYFDYHTYFRIKPKYIFEL